ncbi:hydroxymethylpyrimidine/phosphomethylpyrimidine kinase [Chromohalobacter marismortui]|uniref:hydroxymethylpyrimidine kinase n=1 Tax=Chromohalobacter marismortui TaxID=42055 RepID=A0A4R7NNF2_9GAMM|nr:MULTISPECIES: hydroxymethylpyrimidine/phosphomethylpyrimidine kinase [Chromohalobacter]MCI0509479.1 hydroxymethylpyrimidine/phosphomethylpyrimidine kinase [Chromohalobacter sp.]MCI0592627.1 hydroxymethylpyrimidine/phosphomethylpyrimidine kinase [Chromohalobacter sp.]TDU22198.1 hydroxymethylpyrimidine/phosphomethylpyrimidine kinase [Chromohalobacter marismortui]
MATPRLPTVLVLAGHDPTSGAGLTADAEAIRACGGWPLTVPTALTVQTTRDVQRVMPCSRESIESACAALFADIEISAIKVGLIADRASLEAVIAVVRAHPHLPLIVDPVMRAGGGSALVPDDNVAMFRERLLPLVDILTPNRQELARLSALSGSEVDRVVALMSLGAQAILVTGADAWEEETPVRDEVVHTLHTPDNSRQWRWPRLAGDYHGSGCTLAASLAARLACGESLIEACSQAQRVAWDSLVHAQRPGGGQALPDRLWRLPPFESEAR